MESTDTKLKSIKETFIEIDGLSFQIRREDVVICSLTQELWVDKLQSSLSTLVQ